MPKTKARPKPKDKKCPNCGRLMERRKDHFYCPHCREKHFIKGVIGLVILDSVFNKGSLFKR